ncbi:MAG: TauD/TfdA family dioxygenase [Rhodospirillales bacterium]
MALTVRSLSGVMGAEISGLDLSEPLDDRTKVEINEVFLEHLVVCFRSQSFDIAGFLAAARQFGNTHPHVYRHLRLDGFPDVSVVSSEDKDVHGTGRKFKRAAHFHTDESYKAIPSKATLLYSAVVPPAGGETRFVNMYKAYETLPAETRRRIDPLKAVQRFLTSNPDIQLAALTEEEKAEVPEVVHPVARTHPETGRRALYVNAARTEYVVGMDPQESKALLQDLYDHSLRPEFQYHHHWEVGDLVMWDNRCTMHAATHNLPPGAQRLLYRTLLDGTRPV